MNILLPLGTIFKIHSMCRADKWGEEGDSSCYNVTMLHVTILPTPPTPIPVLNRHATHCHSVYCNQKRAPAASPHATSRPPACSPSLTKNLLPPPSSPLKKQGKARWIHTKTRIFAGSETASARSKNRAAAVAIAPKSER